MLTFLRRKFIPDYQNVKDELVRSRHGVLAAWLGLSINVILVALKLGFAFVLAANANWIFPMALLADAVDNAGDVASNLVTLIGFKVSNKPADADHPYGHERIEYIAGLIVAMLVIFAGIELITTSIQGLASASATAYPWYIFIVLAFSIGLKVLQGIMNLRFAKIISSPALKATAIDSFTDTAATGAVILAAAFSSIFGWTFLDGYFGIAVACFVIYSGYKMILETADPLIGKAASKKEIAEITNMVLSHQEILGVHDVRIHRYGPTKTFISLHAELDGALEFSKVHDIVDDIEDEIASKTSAEVIIHSDPVNLKDKEGLKKKEEAKAIIHSIVTEASIHDFQRKIEEGKEHIEFDIILPYEKKKEEGRIRQNLKQAFPDSILEIQFDYPYFAN